MWVIQGKSQIMWNNFVSISWNPKLTTCYFSVKSVAGTKGMQFLQLVRWRKLWACKRGDFVINEEIDELKKNDNMKLKQDEDLKKKLKFGQGLLILVVVVIVGLVFIVILKAWRGRKLGTSGINEGLKRKEIRN